MRAEAALRSVISKSVREIVHLVARETSSSGRLARVTELLRPLLYSGVKEDPHPILESQELPDLHRPIFGSAAMLVDKPMPRLWTKQAALSDVRLRKQIIHHLLQIVCQPVVDWSRETGLWLSQHFRWQKVPHCLAKNVFGGGVEKSFELKFGRDVPCGEFGKFTVEKRNSYLD